MLALSSQMPICLGTQGQGLERNGLEGSYHARSCTSLLLHPRAQGTYAKSGIYLDTKNYPEVKENDGFKENKTRRVLAGGQVLVGSHEFLVGSIAKRKTGEGDRTLTSHARGAMRTIKQFYKRVPTAYTEKGIARAMRKVVRRAVSREFRREGRREGRLQKECLPQNRVVRRELRREGKLYTQWLLDSLYGEEYILREELGLDQSFGVLKDYAMTRPRVAGPLKPRPGALVTETVIDMKGKAKDAGICLDYLMGKCNRIACKYKHALLWVLDDKVILRWGQGEGEGKEEREEERIGQKRGRP